MELVKFTNTIDYYVKEFYENKKNLNYKIDEDIINNWNDILTTAIRKSILNYIIKKKIGINKNVFITDKLEKKDNKTTINKCLHKKYKNIILNSLDNAQNLLGGRINGREKLIYYEEYEKKYIEFRYKEITNLSNLLKILSRYKIVPKIEDAIICDNNNLMYYIVIYNNHNKNYKQINKENLKNLSYNDKIILNKNIEGFIKKLIYMNILNNLYYTDLTAKNLKDLKKNIYFDDKLNVVFLFTDNTFLYNLNNYRYVSNNYKNIVKNITKKIISDKLTNNDDYIDVKKYVIIRLLHDKVII